VDLPAVAAEPEVERPQAGAKEGELRASLTCQGRVDEGVHPLPRRRWPTVEGLPRKAAYPVVTLVVDGQFVWPYMSPP